MDDLVKRLRSSFSANNKERMPAEVFRDYERERDEAADCIEALDKRNKELETALREIEMLHYDSETDFHHDAMKAHHIARAALEEKKDD